MNKSSYKETKLAERAFEDDYRQAIRVELHDSGAVYLTGPKVQAVWARVDGSQLLSILTLELLASDRDVTHEIVYSGSFTILWD